MFLYTDVMDKEVLEGNKVEIMKAYGRGLLLFLVFLTEINDVMQFIWGKLLGRHKILPVSYTHLDVYKRQAFAVPPIAE